MLEIGICDDEPLWGEQLNLILQDYLKQKQIEAHIQIFTTAEELLASDWGIFQILFLDVVMDQRDGVQLAAEIRRKNPYVSLIFVSSFLDYATMGYQVKASAYLLKSQLPDLLAPAMDTVLLEYQLSQDYIEISVDSCMVSLPLREITYIESQGRIAVFHAKCDYQTYMRFSGIESILSRKGFLRIHRCYIINLAHCLTIKSYQAVLDSGPILPCSRKEYQNLVRILLRWKGTSK